LCSGEIELHGLIHSGEIYEMIYNNDYIYVFEYIDSKDRKRFFELNSYDDVEFIDSLFSRDENENEEIFSLSKNFSSGNNNEIYFDEEDAFLIDYFFDNYTNITDDLIMDDSISD
jgi:hypothetical protein